MQQGFQLFNTLSRKKEKFEPINPPHVGLYVCGPTVYGEPHLGHIRMAITFDILYRYFQNIGYKVRYVRNITDVGHLENEMEESGEDKIEKKARLESIEPMEVAQKYKNLFQEAFNKLNLLSPSIEPLASGHIIEQKEMIDKIIKNGFAYVVKESGSIYFDIKKYNEKYQYNNELRYGALSGRKIEDMLENTRKLAGQSEKKNPLDFALWKEALPNHIMRWKNLFTWKEKEKRNQKTSIGFPGWHLECSAMGTKYLGETFDVHGGGMDLMFPHHECEIAQSVAANGKSHVKYWMHNNMITIDGQKMAKSLNNFITLNELFTGNHKKLEKAYSPMAIRFFVLQAHYRSTLDFSNEALKAAEKGMKRLFEAIDLVPGLPVSKSCSFNLEETEKKCYEALNDDLNTPIAIAHLFELAKFINLVKDGKETIDNQGVESLKKLFRIFVQEIMGLLPETQQKAGNKNMDDLVNLLLNMRLEAKAKKDFETADKIRDELTALGIEIKDKKDGFEWSFK